MAGTSSAAWAARSRCDTSMDMTLALAHHGADGYPFDLLNNPLKQDPGLATVFIRHTVADCLDR